MVEITSYDQRIATISDVLEDLFTRNADPSNDVDMKRALVDLAYVKKLIPVGMTESDFHGQISVLAEEEGIF